MQVSVLVGTCVVLNWLNFPVLMTSPLARDSRVGTGNVHRQENIL